MGIVPSSLKFKGNPGSINTLFFSMIFFLRISLYSSQSRLFSGKRCLANQSLASFLSLAESRSAWVPESTEGKLSVALGTWDFCKAGTVFIFNKKRNTKNRQGFIL